MAHCTQLCTTTKKFYSQQIKIFFLGITLFNTFSLLFQKEKNLMPLFLIACNRVNHYNDECECLLVWRDRVRRSGGHAFEPCHRYTRCTLLVNQQKYVESTFVAVSLFM